MSRPVSTSTHPRSAWAALVWCLLALLLPVGGRNPAGGEAVCVASCACPSHDSEQGCCCADPFEVSAAGGGTSARPTREAPPDGGPADGRDAGDVLQRSTAGGPCGPDVDDLGMGGARVLLVQPPARVALDPDTEPRWLQGRAVRAASVSFRPPVPPPRTSRAA